MQTVRTWCRLARQLRAIYKTRLRRFRRERRACWQHLRARWKEVNRHFRFVAKAQFHGWHLAARQCEEKLATALRMHSDSVSQMRIALATPPPVVPEFKDLVAELSALEAEFAKVTVSSESVSVQTEPIVLEDIGLGPFSIRLHLRLLDGGPSVACFRIVALEPNSPANNQSVTHPHVRHDELCAGDAAAPVQRALEQGRLFDAFCLIRSVLTTYNADSAYVSLKDWEGTTCWNCSGSVDSEDTYYCDHCEHDVCEDCILSCRQCGGSRCRSCQTTCDVCDEACCPRCLKRSDCSETRCCSECLVECSMCDMHVASTEADGNGRCRDCRKADAQAPPLNQTQLITSSPSPGETP